MKQIGKKLGSVFLSLCLVLTMLPTAAFAADTGVDITSKIMSGIQSEIQAALDAASSGDIVTVTGTVTDAASTLTLTIPESATVVWEASITETTGLPGSFFNVQGAGTLEVAEGGTISAINTAIYNSDNAEIMVSGGTVSSSGNTAIINNSTGGVTVSGGTISSPNSYAIHNTSTGVVRISGDAIVQSSANFKPTIKQYNSGTDTSDRIIIEGGTVKNDGTGAAIDNNSAGGVMVSGGMVSSSSSAISNDSTGRVTVSGGTVKK